MSVAPLAILGTGIVTAVGLTAPTACAAIRAKVTNPRETRFSDSGGEWLQAHVAPLPESGGTDTRLARMASMAIAECLEATSAPQEQTLPLLLCVAEESRPGRMDGLDWELIQDIEAQLDVRFSTQSSVIAEGRAGIGTALRRARDLVYGDGQALVVVAGVDSLLTWPQLSNLERNDRLLTSVNSNGFIPGEGAGALLVGRPTRAPQLLCTAIGSGIETATVGSEEPLRADGLVAAFRAALEQAGCGLHDFDLRLTDVSGEQYYMKEAALALSRVMRQRKGELDIWHAAECTGEIGAAAGPVALAVAEAACRKDYSPGPNILFHAGNDSGLRTTVVLTYGAV